MPIDLHVIHASEFVRLGVHGLPDFEASKETLALLAQACRKRGLDRALLDLRSLPRPSKPLFTRTELVSLVATFREAGFTHRQKLAVLYRVDPFRGARLFAFIGLMRGWKVRAFDDFEEAFFWLSEEDENLAGNGGQEIPIRHMKKRRTSAKRTD